MRMRLAWWGLLGWMAGSAGFGIGLLRADEPRKLPDPTRFESQIAAFEREDRKEPPPARAIVVTGSSSIRMWQGQEPGVVNDLAPLTVIPRGFGGSTMHDLLYYADRVILCYRPRAVVIYEGDNDTAMGISPKEVRDTFAQLVRKLHGQNDRMRIYFLAIKPSPKREGVWPKARKANRLIREFCNKDDRLFYIDVASPMLDESGNPKSELFLKDRLHMNRKGYELWKKVIRPVLLKHERAYE